MKKIYIGTSGWSYEHWIAFYSNVPPDKRLNYYSKFFNSVELNTTFYHLPKASTIKNWGLQAPRGFIFSAKASRFITHIKKLKDCALALKQFYKAISGLKNKLGPILFQLPPSLAQDLPRLETFISLLNPKYKYTFEFRSQTWFEEDVFELLKKNKIALCISDLKGELSPMEITSNFIYIRLHGPKKAYQGNYSKAALKSWQKRLEKWAHKYSVYIYFDNDEKGYAVQDAQILRKMINKPKKSL